MNRRNEGLGDRYEGLPNVKQKEKAKSPDEIQEIDQKTKAVDFSGRLGNGRQSWFVGLQAVWRTSP
jgi:hypothetical protein